VFRICAAHYLLAGVHRSHCSTQRWFQSDRVFDTTRPKIAAIATTYFKYSHGQHIVDRFLEGYGWNGTHHHPAMDLVSLYVEQIAMLGFGEFRSAQRLCHAFEEVLQYFRSRRKQTQVISLAECRRQFLFRALALESLFLAAISLEDEDIKRCVAICSAFVAAERSSSNPRICLKTNQRWPGFLPPFQVGVSGGQ
jgi:hypothetical protein